MNSALKKFLKILYSLFITNFDNIAIITSRRLYLKNHNILIKVDAIGDFFIWIPFATSFVAQNHKKPTILVCNKIIEEIAVKLNLFEIIIPVDILKFKRNLFYRFRIIKKINSYNTNLTIQTTFSRDFLIGDSLVKCSNSKEKIGSVGDNSNQNSLQKILSDRWYTKLLSLSNFDSEIYRNQEFFMSLYPNGKYTTKFLSKLIDLNNEFRIIKPYIVIFPGASFYKRMWPIEKFEILIRELLHTFNGEIVICGSKSETNLCKSLESKIGNSRIKNFAGKTSLLEFTEIIRRSKLLISNETSAVHIAATVNVQSICILGGGHYERFIPYPKNSNLRMPIPVIKKMKCFKCDWKCSLDHSEENPFPCIELIDSEKILKIANSYL